MRIESIETLLPENNALYGTLDYWERRYSKDKGVFEWFGLSDIMKEKLESLIIDKNSTILHLGCGNSELGPYLYQGGFRRITNIDYSSNVIEEMKKKAISMSEMEWIVGDVFDLGTVLNDRLFNIAIDKGTVDAFLTQKHDPWNPSKELVNRIDAYMEQVAIHLENGGRFLHITFAQPHFRSRFFQQNFFHPVEVYNLNDYDSGGFDYFLYVCTKK